VPWFPVWVFRDEPAGNTTTDEEQKVEIKVTLQFLTMNNKQQTTI
jgi:hypothetical protein